MRPRIATDRSAVVRQARVDLAAAYRLAARFGFDDTIWNHFTVRMPEQAERFLVKPHGLLFSEVTASGLIVTDLDGNTVEGEGTAEQTGVSIHAAVHLAVQGAACVLHAHPPYATWLSTSERGRLLPLSQDALRFYNRVSYDDDYNGLAFDPEEGRRIARLLGRNRVLLLASHGVVVVGETVAEALYDLYYFELCCEQQYRITCSGAGLRLIPDEVAERTARQFDADRKGPRDFLMALERVLLREEPGFAD